MDVLVVGFPKLSLKLYFETLMDRCSKNSSNLFSRTPMEASEWMKKVKSNIHNLVDFQMAFKMCRKTIRTKAKRNDRYSSKQN